MLYLVIISKLKISKRFIKGDIKDIILFLYKFILNKLFMYLEMFLFLDCFVVEVFIILIFLNVF